MLGPFFGGCHQGLYILLCRCSHDSHLALPRWQTEVLQDRWRWRLKISPPPTHVSPHVFVLLPRGRAWLQSLIASIWCAVPPTEREHSVSEEDTPTWQCCSWSQKNRRLLDKDPPALQLAKGNTIPLTHAVAKYDWGESFNSQTQKKATVGLEEIEKYLGFTALVNC